LEKVYSCLEVTTGCFEEAAAEMETGAIPVQVVSSDSDNFSVDDDDALKFDDDA
jgi:hypothetical protein